MKSNQTHIRKNHREQLNFITKLLNIKKPNIKIIDIINSNHREITAKLDCAAICSAYGTQMKKYDLQKPSKIPYLETTGMLTRIFFKKHPFQCYNCSKIVVQRRPLSRKIIKFLALSTPLKILKEVTSNR